jgi:hypothetical protein
MLAEGRASTFFFLQKKHVDARLRGHDEGRGGKLSVVMPCKQE